MSGSCLSGFCPVRAVSFSKSGLYLSGLRPVRIMPVRVVSYYLDILALFQATLFFSEEHFDTSIAVSITAMLVMYTLNNSVASKLPQTSTIKFIDIWIIYGMVLHFVIIILIVFIELLPRTANVVFVENSQKTEIQMQKAIILAQNVLPILEIVFITCYSISAWIIYIY